MLAVPLSAGLAACDGYVLEHGRIVASGTPGELGAGDRLRQAYIGR